MTLSPSSRRRCWICASSCAQARSSVGDALALAAIGEQLLLDRADARGDGLERAAQDLGEALGGRPEGGVPRDGQLQPLDRGGSLLTLAGGALGDPALGGELTVELRPADGARALVGGAAALLDEPRGAALGLLRRRQPARRLAAARVGLLA